MTGFSQERYGNDYDFTVHTYDYGFWVRFRWSIAHLIGYLCVLRIMHDLRLN